MPFIKILLHLVWTTKDRQKLINKDLKPQLLSHINEYSKEKDIFIDSINAVEDHVHALVYLNVDMAVSKLMQFLKGESSHWVNKNKLTKFHFEWQDEYFAVSVSESNAPRVREYINNQEEHHRLKTFDEEYREFISKYGFKVLGTKVP
jgi:putative transposase